MILVRKGWKRIVTGAHHAAASLPQTLNPRNQRIMIQRLLFSAPARRVWLVLLALLTLAGL